MILWLEEVGLAIGNKVVPLNSLFNNVILVMLIHVLLIDTYACTASHITRTKID